MKYVNYMTYNCHNDYKVHYAITSLLCTVQ